MIRLGLLGCGRIGQVHARAIKDIPDASLVAVADAMAPAAEALAAKTGAEVRNANNIIDSADITGLALLAHTLHPGVHALGAPRRLPLLELCLPALKAMSAAQYQTFKQTLLRLIQADQHIALHEWCLFQLVRHYLDPEFVSTKPSRARYRKLQQVAAPVQTVLSLLAHEGSGESGDMFRLGANTLDLTGLTLLPVQQCGIIDFSRAVHTLADCYPLLKPRLLKAMTLAAGSDKLLSAVEWEIIASIAAVMDCPLPSPTK